MQGTAPVATLEAAPSGQSLDSGTADDPTDDDRIIASPLDGHLGALYANVDGEVGVKISRRSGRRLLPWDSGASTGDYLYRDQFPSDGWPLGFQAEHGSEYRLDWRNRSGAERAVEAAVTVVPTWRAESWPLQQELRDLVDELRRER